MAGFLAESVAPDQSHHARLFGALLMYNAPVPTQPKENAMTEATMAFGAMGEIRKHWGWFLALGIVFVIGGVFAIVMPFIAGLVATTVFAIILVWLGIMQVFQAWSVKSWGGFTWQMIIGLILLLGGLAIWINPILGALTLTIVVAAVFLAKGVFQVILAFQMRPESGWGWVLTAGILAILVGLIIWMDWPVSTAWALGTLAGISLIFSGWSYIAISLAARRV
jgi:uncharacterized membrane protein HdeD (DUF308 family)